MHVSLYRKYRPARFCEVVGQDSAVNMLRSSCLEKRLGHAYMFSGPRGCGKTTAARILAKAVNCESLTADGEPCCECSSCRAVVDGDHMDVMEIDGASNRGIDQIRELKSHVGLASFTGGVKVYILDEVHMLTMEAFNALLKTLEEPPASVMFVFATTEPHKVPVTIRSRCMHIPFHRISTEDMVSHLRLIASSEGFETEEPALWEISRSADGALRDALSMAEQALALGNGRLSSEALRNMLGGGSRAEMERLVSSLRSDPAAASVMLRDMLGMGISPERFLDALYPVLRDMWVFSLWGERSAAGASLSAEEMEFLRSEVPHWGAKQLGRACSSCAALFPKARWGLSTNVFSGVLLQELLSAAGPAPDQTGTSHVPGPAARPIEQQRDGAPPVLSRTAAPEVRTEVPPERPSAVPAIPDATPEAVAELPELMARILANDMALSAALVDARISVSDGKVVVDSSDSSPPARAILESPRSRAVISSALGLDRPDQDASTPISALQDVIAAAAGRERAQAPSGTRTHSGMTIEEISARLGADLLVSKGQSREDDEELMEKSEDIPIPHDAEDAGDHSDD
ncbi:MAG: DNA polymerase III subunit gamma/tau [Synergistaceae bacterium]|nr:DNA polymerase III subunit gamma/tau [Synergistaceae bacterium]